jgi:PAS domain S-box-containing protein
MARNQNFMRGEVEHEFPTIGRRKVLLNARPISGKGNFKQLILLSIHDITERKKAEEATARLAAIVEFSDDAIISKDLSGVITTWNKGAERLFGYRGQEAIGQSVTMLIPPERADELPDILERIQKGESIEQYETVRRRKDGTLLDISLTVSPIVDKEGRIIGASKISRDITARKRAEQELAECLEREKVAGRMKDNFLAMLSHELRTPLNPVLLIASDSAHNPEIPADIRAQFEVILKNVEVEVQLIDDLLDLSQINHGKLKLKMEIVDAHAVLDEAIKTMQGQIDEKQIHVESHLNAEQHFIAADAVRLKQIFWNILKNAVKFTSKGGKIKIESFSPAESGQFNLKISDTGMGMTPEELERLFSAFSQGDHVRDKFSNYGGLGLGLAISKRLVELHSGRIGAASNGRGCGAAFSVEFPLAHFPSHPAERARSVKASASE